MFGKSISLFKLFGFEVKIDLSWLVIAALITWSLATGVFPYYYKKLSTATYWWMGIFGALGLFFSIVFHELCHSLVARKFNLPMKGITLFIFGGVAEMEEEPPSPKAEFYMAIAGPLSSILIAIVFYGIRLTAQTGNWPALTVGVFSYVSYLNFLLAGFNLVPAFPLDGGRVFRSILWGWKNNLKWATRIASQIGSGFGLVLIFFGVLYIIRGAFISGIWWFLIGLFLRNASQMSYSRLLMSKALEGEPVKRFMKTNPISAPPSITVEKFVDEFLYKYHYKMFPIVEDQKLIGCITTREVKEVPRDQWNQRTIGEIVKPCSCDNTITSDTDAMKALSNMNKTGVSRLLVVDGDRLAGIIALKDLMGFLSLKLDLEEETVGES
jgi:Zn-dependent protease/predicted transcriptional regulator